MKSSYVLAMTILAVLFVCAPAAALGRGPASSDPGMRGVAPVQETAPGRNELKIAREIRHELLTLPYYGVFDWIQGEVRPDGTVVLAGQVVRETTKSDAAARVRDIDGVKNVENRIQVLPVSPNDDRLRVALYRSIFNYDGPMFRYATLASPPIHIIVNNGHVTLRGTVATETDRNYANVQARSVPGVFSVDNELVAESSVRK